MPPALARWRRVHERRELLPRAARGGVTCARSLLPLVLASRRPHPVFTCHLVVCTLNAQLGAPSD